MLEKSSPTRGNVQPVLQVSAVWSVRISRNSKKKSNMGRRTRNEKDFALIKEWLMFVFLGYRRTYSFRKKPWTRKEKGGHTTEY